MTDSGPDLRSRALHGRVLHPGIGAGEVLLLDAPLSFWGGTEHTGTVIDARHPQHGQSLAGRVVAMTAGRGSSSSSGVLAEQIRSGHAPAALLVTEPDTILVIGALAAAELYGLFLPIVQLETLQDLAEAAGRVVEVTAEEADEQATIRLTGPVDPDSDADPDPVSSREVSGE